MSTDDTPPRAAFLARLDTAVTLLWDANRDDSEDAARPNDPEVDVWTAAANLSNTLRKYGDVVRDEVWDLLVPSADAVELHPAPAPVPVREDETVPWLKREVDQMGTAILQAEYDREFQAQAYSRLLRGMARRASRYRRKLHLAAQDAARHHAARAAAPETSDPNPAEVASRLRAVGDAACGLRYGLHGGYVRELATWVERDPELARAVACALSGEATPDAR